MQACTPICALATSISTNMCMILLPCNCTCIYMYRVLVHVHALIWNLTHIMQSFAYMYMYVYNVHVHVSVCMQVDLATQFCCVACSFIAWTFKLWLSSPYNPHCLFLSIHLGAICSKTHLTPECVLCKL